MNRIVGQIVTAEPRAGAHSELAKWIARLAVLVSLGVLLAASTGTLLAFSARDGWRLELFSHFRAQYCWSLAVAAAVLAVARWRKTALLAAVFAAVNLVLILPLYIGAAPPAAAAKLRGGMSLNVFYHNHDYSLVLDEIARVDPDFVLLLEVTPEWAKAIEVLQVDYPFSRVAASEDSSGMALYSRLPMPYEETYSLAHTGLPTIIAQLVAPSGRFTLFCAHTASPTSEANFSLRNRQLEDLAVLAAGQAGAVVVMGDLNTTSWSPYFSELLERSGLRDSRRGFGVDGSWPAAPLPLRIPIDHCLVSREVAVYSRRVGRSVGSDHRPIIVEFAIVK